jgi:hypothetical protein
MGSALVGFKTGKPTTNMQG